MSRNKKPKIKGKRLGAAELRHEIMKLFRRHPRKRLNAKQIIKKLKIDNNKDSVADALEKLSKDEKLIAVDDVKFQINRSKDDENPNRPPRQVHIGTVDMTRTGSAYIVIDGLDNDVYVPAKYLKSAIHRDKVEVAVFTPRGRRRPEGEVLKVVERAREHFMGTLRVWKNYAIVMPDQLNIPMDIYVDLKDIKEGKDGNKVVVKVTEWPDRKNHTPRGIVTSVLGAVGTSDIEMKGILINNGFELEFPEEVMRETEGLTEEILPEEVEKRRDMRDIITFTIDPTDAKDFDDALSFRYLEDGTREIGVHIADVTHFIKPGTALDKEALNRSTSVYLVDRVLPMLPEKLSNQLCSLRPHEDKYTFSAVFTFDNDDRVIDRWFGKTLIHSDRRFTYGEAQVVLDSGEGDFHAELKELNRLAHVLRKRRFKQGSINFDVDEVRFKLDEEGVPIEVYVKERKDAHMLIEDFMLLANREVAAFISKKGKDNEIPFVYRVHDEPDIDKVQEFALFARQLGFQMNTSDPRAIGRSFNALVEAAKTNEVLEILEPLAIRTMAKAEYSSDNIGHYGLGFDYYTHFTSPIRRYSDVLVHRFLEPNIEGTLRTNKAKLEEQCKHISIMERRAVEAERESIKYKQVEYIKNHIGEVFEGYISGIIDKGFFVELVGNHCEGMVEFSSLDDEFELINGRLKARGKYSGLLLKMGDQVNVKIIGADLAKRRIEMALIETNEAPND